MADIAVERAPDNVKTGRTEYVGTGRRLSWGAIFAGFFVAIGTQLILSLLGIAIGLSSWSPATPGGVGAGDVATGVGIWAAVSALISLFIGGATTGHLAGMLTPKDGFLHGAILWSLVTVATIWLVLGGMGFLLGGAFSVVGRTASATIGAAGEAATELAPRMMDLGDADARRAMAEDLAARSGINADEARDILERAEARAREVGSDISARVASADVLTDEQRTALVTAISQRNGIDADSARAIADAAQARAEAARTRAAGAVDSVQGRVQDASAALDAERQALADEIAEQTGMSPEAARSLVVSAMAVRGAVQERAGERIADRAHEARQEVRQAAEDVTDSTARGAWWTLLALGLSLGAAGAGAAATARR